MSWIYLAASAGRLPRADGSAGGISMVTVAMMSLPLAVLAGQ